MYRCRTMYHTPTGYIYADSEGKTAEEAKAMARERCQFGLVSIEWMSIYEERDEGADDGAETGGDEPTAAGCDVLHPEVVAPGEHDEVLWNADNVAGSDGGAAGKAGSGLPVGSEGKLLLVLGKPDEMKVVHLSEHRLLIDGAFLAAGFEPSLEVSDLPRVPSNLQQVPGEVGRHGFHGRLRSGGFGGLARTILAALVAAITAALVARWSL